MERLNPKQLDHIIDEDQSENSTIYKEVSEIRLVLICIICPRHGS